MSNSKIYNKVYILCDCNNFFASCEKLFRPDLKTKPVLVLSNNDGVVVSRSYESKALGIPMGCPVFKIKNDIDKNRIVTFSSNFSLYIDISNRVMRKLEEFCQNLQIYSVDEAFLEFDNIKHDDVTELAYKIKNSIKTFIGIDIGMGIAQTKTLAKLASHHAKKTKSLLGVCNALDDVTRIKILQKYPICEIWGVGRQLEAHLTDDGFVTCYQLSKANEKAIQKKYGIVLTKTVRELNNVDCIDDVDSNDSQNQIMWSRSFKLRLTTYDELKEAISNFTAEACSKLRKINRFASKISIFIRTSYFGNVKKYGNEAALKLDFPSNDTRVFMAAAQKLLDMIYKDGYDYMKAGVILYDFSKDRTFQSDLFMPPPTNEDLEKSDAMMKTLDNINNIQKNTVYLGAQNNLTSSEKFKDPQYLSPHYTSKWDELPEVF